VAEVMQNLMLAFMVTAKMAQVFIVKALIMKPYMQKHNRMKPLQLPPIK
jgi:hypothetical protein